MSTIYSDALNNKFLGNCKWGNHNINYPTKDFLMANPLSSIFAGITNLATEAGLLFRSVISQSKANTMTAVSSNNYNFPYYLAFGFPGDIDDRITFINNFNGTANLGPVTVYTDVGLSDTSNNGYILNTTSNVLFGTKGDGNIPSTDSAVGSAPAGYTTGNNISEIQFAACASANSFGLSVSQFVLDSATVRREFFYACKLSDINTNFNYYNLDIKNQLFVLNTAVNGSASNYTDGRHYIANAPKRALQSGDAIYPIACEGGSPTPTGQWATDMYVFDNNATLGYPCIGRVPNMLLGVGTFTYLKPVELITAPDAGSNLWLPVGTYAGRTLLMRCYSE